MNYIVLVVTNVLFAFAFFCSNEIALTRIIWNRLALLLLLFSILTALIEQKVKKLPPYAYYWLSFVSYIGLSTIWSADIEMASSRALWIIYIAIAYGLSFLWVREDKQFVAVLKSACIGASILVAGVIWSYITRQPSATTGYLTSWEGARYSLSTVNPAVAAAPISLCIPIAWHLFHENPRSGKATKIIAYLFTVLAPVALVLTGSRGAALASLFGYAYVAVSTIRGKHPWRYVFTVAGVVIGCLITISYFKGSGNIAYLVDRVMLKSTTISEPNVTSRFNLWMYAWSVFAENPLFGSGIGSARLAVDEIGTSLVIHNSVLSVLSEFGLVGIALTASIIWSSLRAVRRCARKYQSMFYAILVTLLFSVMFESFETQLFFWATLLLPVLASRLLPEPQKESSEDEKVSYSVTNNLSLDPTKATE